jgi:hypothetical protein
MDIRRHGFASDVLVLALVGYTQYLPSRRAAQETEAPTRKSRPKADGHQHVDRPRKSYNRLQVTAFPDENRVDEQVTMVV